MPLGLLFSFLPVGPPQRFHVDPAAFDAVLQRLPADAQQPGRFRDPAAAHGGWEELWASYRDTFLTQVI